MGVEVGAAVIGETLLADAAIVTVADAAVSTAAADLFAASIAEYAVGETVAGAAFGDLVLGDAFAEAALAGGVSGGALTASTIAAIGADAAVGAGLLSVGDAAGYFAATGQSSLSTSSGTFYAAGPDAGGASFIPHAAPFEAGFVPSAVTPGAAEGVVFTGEAATATSALSNVKTGLDLASKAQTAYNFLNGQPSSSPAVRSAGFIRGDAASGNNYFQIGTAPVKTANATYGNGAGAVADPAVPEAVSFPWELFLVIGGLILLVKGKKS